MRKVLRAIWNYLRDWRNWVSHTIVGLFLLAIALFLPVKPIFRIAILIAVVAFNTWRMKRANKMKRS